MLEDRYYMRESSFDARRSVTFVLLIVNAVVFLLQLAVARFSSFPVNHYFALSLDGLAHGYAWQLLTYMFMHFGVLHVLVNCWAIYVFGNEVEQALGRNSFIALYFSTGIVGGLLQAAAGLTFGSYFGGSVIGASAAAFGLVAAYAILFPDRIILLFFIIPLRARYLLMLSAVLAVAGMLAPQTGPVHYAHAAHLGGMITGILFIRYAAHWEWRLPKISRPRRTSSPRRLVNVISSNGPWSRTKRDDLPPEEFLSKEVDPILDKISAHGIQSLTERERRILEAARQRMGKR
jgi:membrane associated rhomboid family serine protease